MKNLFMWVVVNKLECIIHFKKIYSIFFFKKIHSYRRSGLEESLFDNLRLNLFLTSCVCVLSHV